jgi:hypothetical protein
VSSLYFRFAARADSSAPAPLLDRLLARADGYTVVDDWRAAALGSATAVAPVALYAAHGAVPGAWACLATPVRYTVEMSNVRLGREGILQLDANTAAGLAVDFNQVWRDSGIRMLAGRFADLFCIFDSPLRVATQDPERVLDRHIEEFLPQGEDAPRLRRLMSEMEMWLFERVPPVNGLWLWGGGELRTSALAPEMKSSGEDALFSYFAGDVSQGGVVKAPEPGSAEWPKAESQWLRPAVEALKAGRIEQLRLSAADRCYTLRASSLKRFWRRTHPWSTKFA